MKERPTALLWFLVFSALLLSGLCFMAVKAEDPMDPSEEARFLEGVASGCIFKIESGRIAHGQAAAQEVRDLGSQMSEHYSAMLSSVRRLAERKKIALPEKPDTASQNTLSYLGRLRWAEIDREYTSLVADDLSTDLKDFRRVARMAPDPEVRDFAQRWMVMLKQDLKIAEKLSRTLPQPVLK